MFDVPVGEESEESFSAELPDIEDDWRIGVIVGPSGSGKTTIARQAYGECLYGADEWRHDCSVVDCFDESRSIKEISGMLTSVGFSSPPAWIKPYQVLSNGQKFRCDLARALLSGGDLVAFDEFTSVVDRRVAQIGSAAVAKAVRRTEKQKFIAVACHYDIVDWLEPDWVLDTASMKLARGRLRRPDIKLWFCRGSREAWPLFAKHHYLSASLAPAARTYLAMVDDQPVGLCAFLPSIGNTGSRRVTRIVVLPDFQGVGIGSALLLHASRLVQQRGLKVTITTAHPGMISHLKASENWRVTNVMRTGGAKSEFRGSMGDSDSNRYKSSAGRAVVSARLRNPKKTSGGEL